MGLLDERKKTAEAIAEGRFINHVLGESAKNLDKKISKRMAHFSSSFWSKRNFSANENTLTYSLLKQHRFVDMKTRQSEDGRKKKKHHQIYNKPVYGELNNIIRELNIGFTKAIKQQFMALDSVDL